MLESYGFIGLYIIVAISFAVIMVLLPVVFRFLKVVPHHPNPTKSKAFECGMESIGNTWIQFNVRFYFYAILFVALDVLVVFIYPLAVRLRSIGTSGFFGILIFVGIIVVGYLYAWKKRALEWK